MPRDAHRLGRRADRRRRARSSAASSRWPPRSRAREGIAEGGYRIVTNVGTWGGQSVDHLHFHLMGGRPFTWPRDDAPAPRPGRAPRWLAVAPRPRAIGGACRRPGRPSRRPARRPPPAGDADRCRRSSWSSRRSRPSGCQAVDATAALPPAGGRRSSPARRGPVLQVPLPDDPSHGFIVIYAARTRRQAATAAANDQADATSRSSPGGIQFPPARPLRRCASSARRVVFFTLVARDLAGPAHAPSIEEALSRPRRRGADPRLRLRDTLGPPRTGSGRRRGGPGPDEVALDLERVRPREVRLGPEAPAGDPLVRAERRVRGLDGGVDRRADLGRRRGRVEVERLARPPDRAATRREEDRLDPPGLRLEDDRVAQARDRGARSRCPRGTR